MVDASDNVARAYARLSSLRQNLPAEQTISGAYVAEYHKVLGDLEQLGFSLEEFKIPPEVLFPPLPPTSKPSDSYSKDRYLDRALFMAKLDAVLTYFQLTSQEPERRIRFRLPKKESEQREP